MSTKDWMFLAALLLLAPNIHAQATGRKKTSRRSGIAVVRIENPVKEQEQVIDPAGLPPNTPQPPPIAFRCFGPMPQFPGDLSTFIANNLRYPDSLEKEGFEGCVVISFIIRADGSVDSAQVVRPVHPLMDEEAKRLISIMPRWTPGKQGCKAVDVCFTLPIVFKLD